MESKFKACFLGIMNFFGNLKIQSKLLMSFVSVFIVSILVVIFAFYNNWTNSLQSEAINYSSLYIKQLNENLNTYIYELDRLTAMTLADARVQEILISDELNLEEVEIMRNVEYMEGFLFNLYTMQPDIKKIIVIGENGSLFVEGARAYSLLGIDPKKYPWYMESAGSGGKIKIYTDLPEESFIGVEKEEKKLSVVRQIINTDNNRFIGCIRIDIPFSKIEDMVKKISETSSMEIIISDHKYSGIFDINNKLGQINKSELENIPDKEDGGKEGSIQLNIGSKGHTVVLSGSIYSNWIVMGVISNSDLLTQTQKVRDISIFIAAITILIIFIFSFIISFGITNPLKKLIYSMKSVQEGNFDVEVKVPYGDEVGEISRSFNIMVARINNLVRKEYYLRIKNKEAELKALQAQINPHFLYNTLESLRMKALVNNDPQVAEMAKKISMFYRLNIIRKSELVFLSEELDHVRYYMDIQNMRYNNRFIYIEDMDDEIKGERILKLTLQPLVENAIFHGLEPKVGRAVIILKGWRSKEDLFIEIADNGVGISQCRLEALKRMLETAVPEENSGIGILNVHSRLKLYFGDMYGINISSEEGKGTKILIRLPGDFQAGGDKDAEIIDS